MTPDSASPSPVALPAGFALERVLARSPSSTVVLARRGERHVVVRIMPALPAGEHDLAELAVLAAVQHPALAGLIDFGTTASGETFVAREWIDGEDLLAWTRRLRAQNAPDDDREIGRVIAELCVPLAHLHARGFVHADLKATNVIVTPSGRVVLTDFGLARAAHSAAAASGARGSLFSIAPEELLGGRIDARADLFALGVLMHELWIARRASAREFYARFPAQDFFTASGTTIDELPDWSRDIVARLLEIDPSRRYSSAHEVESALAGRLGLARARSATAAVELAWPTALGRAAFFESWSSALRAECERAADATGGAVATLGVAPQWCVFPVGEDVERSLEHMRLQLALAGAPVRRIDSSAPLQARAAADVDRWARALASDGAGRVYFVACPGDPLGRRAVDALARAIAIERRTSSTAAVLVAGSTEPCGATDSVWRSIDVPPIDVTDVERFLEQRLESFDERARAVARAIWRAGNATTAGIDAAIRSAIEQGWIVPGASKPRLRAGALPETLAVATRREAGAALVALSDDMRDVLAALHVCDGSATRGELARITGRSGAQTEALTQALVDARCVEIESGAHGGVVRVLAAAPSAPSLAVDEARWRALHERCAEQLEAQHPGAATAWAHRFRAHPSADVLARLRAELERWRESGIPELALATCERVRAQAREAGVAFDPHLAAEEALAWAALGQPERALASIDPSPASQAAAAVGERVRGHVALLRHEYEGALEHFTRAAELDPSERGEAAFGRARLYFETRRDDELEALAKEIADGGFGALPVRHRITIDNLTAMSRFRRGRVDEARALLEATLADAQLRSDSTHEAPVRINLATVARRGGRLHEATQHLERAESIYAAAGVLTGVAQVRALHGATLREEGELARAGALLASALEIRERNGDVAGATAVRGMLGLLHADRGHAKPALEELATSARSLRASGRSADAGVLDARAEELSARLGHFARAPSSGSAENDADPRILLARARAAALARDLVRARELAQRAALLSDRLKLEVAREESAWLVEELRAPQARRAHPAATATESAPLVALDRRTFALLRAELADARTAFEAESLARELERRGRDDRAARMWMALAARGPTAERQRAHERARALLVQTTRGLAAAERAAFERALCGLPDPYPADLEAWEDESTGTEEWDMDVVQLLEINHRLVKQEDLGELLGAIVESALMVTGAERGFLVLEEDGVLSFDKALDSQRGDIAVPEVEVSKSIVREALERMQPLRLSNAVDDPLLGSAPSVTALELRSILCVPFEIVPGSRGVIYIDHRLRRGAFAERAERLLALLADQAALAILQVRRVAEIRRLNRELNRDVASKESDLRQARAVLRDANLVVPASGLIGTSSAMTEVHRWIERAAPSKLAVLVVGQSGTGKELAARALHSLSPRSSGPFVSENCAALPPSLIEAELFGYRKGAYTGADQDRAGIFERASGGTLFLDEIGELPLEVQAKLLRVLETGEVRRLGDSRVQLVDFRLVAATHRDLEDDVRAGKLRADLFYRLDGLRIALPPLAARVADIPMLVDHFLRLESAKSGVARRIAPAVLTKLCARGWPGNVRELSNEIARLCVLSEGDVTDPALVRAPGPELRTPLADGGAVLTLAELERRAIERALEAAGGDKRRAAEMLGISRAKIYQRIKEWQLEKDGGTGDADVTASS
ncbi:MAG: sigma 54-interacting transcriptional regulator [Planctomycetota bacterium]